MTLKLNIGQKNGKTIQKELSEEHSKALKGVKIGQTFKGDKVGLSGYEFKVTGGSDNAGFPMRRDVEGTSRKRILVTKGIGFQGKRKGLKQRRMVAGNTVYDGTSQLNVSVEKEGKAPLDGASEEGGEETTEEPQKAPEEKKEEAKEEAPKEDKKEEKSDADSEAASDEDDDASEEEASEDEDSGKEEKDEPEGDGEDDSGDEGASDEPEKDSEEDSKEDEESEEKEDSDKKE